MLFVVVQQFLDQAFELLVGEEVGVEEEGVFSEELLSDLVHVV